MPHIIIAYGIEQTTEKETAIWGKLTSGLNAYSDGNKDNSLWWTVKLHCKSHAVV